MSEAIQRVERAIDEIKKGRMVIMMDDEDRENEGDLVYAATFSTPEKVNFMAKEARGLICAPVTREIAQRLDLVPMVERNDSQHETAFTVSIDAANARTGISAAERSECISLLASPISKPEDFVRPGHIFPLIAKDGGVLVRTGHTEGSIDLCKLAGLAPVAVICEIIKDDGTMARRDDLREFSKRHDMPIVYISDLVEYRLANEKLVKRLDEEEIEFRGVKVTKIRYEDHLRRIHTVIQFYKIHESENVRFHNIGPDIDLILDDKRYRAMENAIDYLKHNGGLLIFLDSKTVSKEQAKEIGVGAQILQDLGVRSIKLLTTNVETEFVGLSGFGLDVVEKIDIG
ncbi:bifunctional 3,4-dihydroxy-2-butanone 4-phosphate synthase/GTP cyclohydrolase II [Nitratifractor salsuginis]|uniref:3,4-dihydroxy-2-butanone 4-phosphate synthase n=1 Tax=Nitratifractor salsuginis (strain DSM 16511 / JCM 12458 / E9I37-1) TaxID=749222 RepID=E6WXP5_NITSE|nr:bifunctional 3,4-dihydroxy-2-butanone 4-phosphate synthase/GTP cyclohydrolase II [Nitratifractor salsuginis]ADV46302.1 GTP cyclohydrolase II; 3,4-dihydroxy-2-butanone 4-phosphate synthase [Nitratifractor salsuginis DSM 16511]